MTASNSRAWPGLAVAGEPVVIPYRIYNPAPPLHLASGLNRTEQVITAALYSRHHDGHVRQQALGTLLECDEPWTAPQNPCFAELTRQRAISYWSCYYRALHASRVTYPALTALSRLDGSTAA